MHLPNFNLIRYYHLLYTFPGGMIFLKVQRHCLGIKADLSLWVISLALKEPRYQEDLYPLQNLGYAIRELIAKPPYFRGQPLPRFQDFPH
jgi:hypothetical protein